MEDFDLEPVEAELPTDFVPEEGDEGFTPKGQYFDTEYGDTPPNHVYESGMYLGDGVWVSEDFFG